jgi:hypothetical protein
MRPHLAVHRRRDEQRTALDRARQAQQAQQVVGSAMHELGDEVGAGRGDEHRVGLACRLMCAMLFGSRASHWLV